MGLLQGNPNGQLYVSGFEKTTMTMGQNRRGVISPKNGVWHHSYLWYNLYLVAKFEGYIPSLKLKQRLRIYTVAVGRNVYELYLYEQVTYA